MFNEGNNGIVLYQSTDGSTNIDVRLEGETVWLNQEQIGILLGTKRAAITKHILNIYREGELVKDSTCSILEHVGTNRKRQYQTKYYNLDMILSVGYRVNSKHATQFRIWATSVLKEYLIKGYAINEHRLKLKQQEVEYLKTGIRILNRSLIEHSLKENNEMLKLYAKGLELLDDYDHETLDEQGRTEANVAYPLFDEYMNLVFEMYSDFESSVFAQPKDDTFHSSINQIGQTFGGADCYPSIEEKAAMLLYLIVKNHSFVDGNKRIAAACFLYFLKRNNALFNADKEPIISNEALAALTLFIATSKTEEMEIVKRFVISILNRNK